VGAAAVRSVPASGGSGIDWGWRRLAHSEARWGGEAGERVRSAGRELAAAALGGSRRRLGWGEEEQRAPRPGTGTP
jgi:hypothetical protein